MIKPLLSPEKMTNVGGSWDSGDFEYGLDEGSIFSDSQKPTIVLMGLKRQVVFFFRMKETL